MKDKEFLNKLSEVAIWKIAECEQETSINAKKKRGRKTAEELYQEEHEKAFIEIFNGVRLGAPPLVLKVHNACDCEDCGEHCPSGRKLTVKNQTTNGKMHWRKRCETCGLCLNPYNNRYELSGTDASVKWNSFLKDTKGSYQTEANLRRKQITRKTPDSEDSL